MAAPSLPAEFRRLRRDLLAAGDSHLHRVVAMVDALAERGAADTLIHPLRPRLAELRPQRRLNFTRLLFAPVEPLIVPAPIWRPDSPAVPRSALRPLDHRVRAAMGAEVGSIDRQVAGRTTDDTAALSAAGARLWPAAAAALQDGPPPPDWTAVTGLAAALYAPLARPLAALFGEGVALHALTAAPDETAVREAARLLRGVAAAAPAALAMMLAVLLARLPHAKGLVLLADDLAAQRTDEARAAPDWALDFLLGGAGIAADAGMPAALIAEQARRGLLLLEEIQSEAEATQRPSRLARAAAARRRLDATCREHFQSAAARLAAASAGGPDVSVPAEIAVAESAARDLRRLEAVGRRLGDAAGYDGALRATAARLARDQRLTRVDRLRLAEILLGPDAALAMIGAG